MPKKMKIIPSIFKTKQPTQIQIQPWQWPSSCNHPKTLSFRGHDARCDDFLTGLPDPDPDPAPLEAVTSGARLSERLFFEPEETSSIVRAAAPAAAWRRPFKDGVAMALESEDPYGDFRRSMEEMVESQGMFRDWDCLEELLLWYLRMNGKMNHRFIVGAFVDLLVSFAAADAKTSTSVSDSTSTMYSSASSSFSLSPPHQHQL